MTLYDELTKARSREHERRVLDRYLTNPLLWRNASLERTLQEIETHGAQLTRALVPAKRREDRKDAAAAGELVPEFPYRHHRSRRMVCEQLVAVGGFWGTYTALVTSLGGRGRGNPQASPPLMDRWRSNQRH